MTRFHLVLPLLLIAAPTVAAPRIGAHEGFTRLAFDLPRTVTPVVTSTPTGVRITLAVPLKAEAAPVKSDDVKAYEVRADGQGSVVTVTLAAGRRAKVFVLPPAGTQGARLVVDAGPGLGGTAASAASPAPPAASAAQSAHGPAKQVERPKLRVVLDAGHGGADPGMVGYVMEKQVTLAVALKVRQRLQARGMDVVMTRAQDAHLSRDKSTDLNLRAKMASSGTVNAFVSIHVNAASPQAQGIETWVFGQLLEGRNRSLAVRENGGGAVGERITRESSNIAQNLLGDLLAQSNLAYSRKLASLVQAKLISSTGAVNRGVAAAPFAVIRNARTPAILIELGFGTHPVEGPKLGTDAYQERLAEAIANAIAEFLHVD